MKRILLALVFLMVVGCDTQTPAQKDESCKVDCILGGFEHGTWLGYTYCNCYNTTITINNDIINEVEVIKYINTTISNCTVTNRTIIVTESNSSYVLSLIRQIKRCEWREGNRTNISYNNLLHKWNECNASLESIREAIK